MFTAKIITFADKGNFKYYKLRVIFLAYSVLLLVHFIESLYFQIFHLNGYCRLCCYCCSCYLLLYFIAFIYVVTILIGAIIYRMFKSRSVKPRARGVETMRKFL